MEEFLRWNWPTPAVSELITKACFWAGYAIFIGMTAQSVVNLKFSRSPQLTLCIGVVSVTSGLFTLRSFFDVDDAFDPVSPPAILVALAFGLVAALMCKIGALLFPMEEEDEEEIDDDNRYYYEDDGYEQDLEQYAVAPNRRNQSSYTPPPQREPTRRELERERQKRRFK